jgi:hypothetical protein
MTAKALLFTTFLLCSMASLASAIPPAIQPFLDQHCIDCHDSDVKKGGLDLSALTTTPTTPATLKKWVRIFDRVAAHEMPPPKKPQPSPSELQAFATALSTDLTTQYNTQKGTVLRRLNRREYQNTINDLLGINVNLIDALPEDGRAQGFDNIGSALSISGIQMLRYMETAELALNAALSSDQRPVPTTQRATLESERNKEPIGKHWLKQSDGSIVVFNDGGFPSTVIPQNPSPSPSSPAASISATPTTSPTASTSSPSAHPALSKSLSISIKATASGSAPKASTAPTAIPPSKTVPTNTLAKAWPSKK